MLQFLSHLELELVRLLGAVDEGPSDGVQVVGADGHQGALPCQVLVQLVLQGDETCIT